MLVLYCFLTVQSVSGYICTLQASVNKDPAHESALKSAVKYVTGDYSTQYCRTATGVYNLALYLTQHITCSHHSTVECSMIAT